MYRPLLKPLFLSIFALLLIPAIFSVFAQDKTDSHPQAETAGDVVDGIDESNVPLDLKWLIKEAMGRNPELAATQKRLNAGKAKISQAKSLDDPVFRVGSFDMADNPFHLEGETDQLQQRFGISQKIPFPGKLRLREEIAAEEANAIEKELYSKVQEITALVKSAFYELYYIDNAIDINKENKDLLRMLTKIAETKYSVGRATQRDVLAAQVEFSTLSNNLIVLNKERHSIVARLNILLDRPTQIPLGSPSPFEKHTLNLTLEELEDLATENRPELKMFETIIKRSEAEVKLSKRDYYFSDFEPMVEYMQENGASDTWASAITINLPWLWPKNRARVKETKETLDAAKLDYRFINNKTLFEVQDLLVKIQSSESTVKLYKTAVIPQAEQSLKSARIGYETDKVDFLALIDSQRILLNSKVLYYRALTDFEQNFANMERAIGMQLTQ